MMTLQDQTDLLGISIMLLLGIIAAIAAHRREQ